MRRLLAIFYPDLRPFYASFLDLLILYRVYTPTEVEDQMNRYIRDNKFMYWLASYLDLQRETEKRWQASQAGQTYMLCRKRWQHEGNPPEVHEAAAIMKPLLTAVKNTRSTPEDTAKARAEAWLAFPDCGGRDPEELRSLLSGAPFDPVSWYAVELIYDNLRSGGGDVPQGLSNWMVDRCRRKIDRPRLKRGSPPVSFRSLVIRQMIEALLKLGMTATRNDGSDATSACDAVAQAMDFNYERVRRRWSSKTKDIAFGELAGLQEPLGWIWEEYDRSVPHNPTLFLKADVYINSYMESGRGFLIPARSPSP